MSLIAPLRIALGLDLSSKMDQLGHTDPTITVRVWDTGVRFSVASANAPGRI